MAISAVHDPFMLGLKEGTEIRHIRRKDWELTQKILRVTAGIPRNEINPLYHSEVAWVALDTVIQLWKRTFPEEAQKFWGREAASAKLSGSGATRDHSMRVLVSMPNGLLSLIKAVFPGQSLSGGVGKDFWHKFAQRYPALRAPEHV